MITVVRDTALEVLTNCKAALIGSGLFVATQAIAELSGERQVKYAMMYLGVIVAVLTITKLAIELVLGWERIKEALEKRKERKQRQHDKVSK